MAAPKYLREVTDSFSLFNTVRKYTDQNDRLYLISGLRDIINSPKIQEHMKLRELRGYFGHEKRRIYATQNNNDIHIPENAMVVIDGKVVDVVNIPTNICVDISVNDDGLVTHTEQILDNDLGHVVSDLYDAKVGGWSWATKGGDGAVSNIKDFGGFDWVYGENFISLDKASLMFESSGNMQEQILSRLKAGGIKQDNALSIVEYLIRSQQNNLIFESALIVPNQQMEMVKLMRQVSDRDSLISDFNNRITDLEKVEKEHSLMLEKAGTRDERLRRILSSVPVFINDQMMDLIINPQTEDDVKASQAFMESIGSRDLSTLPLGQRQRLPSDVKIDTGVNDSMPKSWIKAPGGSNTGF